MSFNKARNKRLRAKQEKDLGFFEVGIPDPFYPFIKQIEPAHPCTGCVNLGKGPCHCTIPYLQNPIYVAEIFN